MTSKIKISGITYSISYKPIETLNGNIGLANFNTQEISIANECSEQTKRIARTHEILHILSDSYGLSLTEHQVKYLTHALIAFVEDNPNYGI